MKIAISNIAWQVHEEEAIASLMQNLNITGVEVAPTKMWNSPLSASDAEIASYRKFWESRGIQIVAMQALLFGRNDLTIFQDVQKRKETIEYLSGIIELGGKLGATALVFGSPKNRSIVNLELEEVEQIAKDFFYDLGEVASKKGVVFCIEPNPTAYACDFITTSSQGLDLVNRVDSDGFGLHLDAAGMTMSEEAIGPSLQQAFQRLCHFHISEPNLAQIGTGGVEHQTFSKTLSELNYKGWKSVEMRAQNPDSNISGVEQALQIAIEYYAT
ncbi:sugar phosphate isomerase/epimerase family protein [Argonema galeatum]|uniref:sugar phosphate isomerase/epimerase family protein n=1 Tax=Argonema galeatum TaxID=2942762 RepID=UPI00201306BA|nr:sugar phosphate isomerase/epimerase [Argonema galeatum]MCL1464402.1 sugar phosphate isomerase/epimerase [Argonema galeatum A003/A1]